MALPYEEMKIKFGKYKGTMLMDLPDSYLKWLFDQDVKGKIRLYIQNRLQMPKQKFNILETITGRIYEVDAYGTKDAYYFASRQHQKEVFAQESEFTIIQPTTKS